ncbi:MAG: hypothetical protein DRJ57_00870 [Thermoprotei archaeon]|nr:MAG: hypothetical protein DRJ57_00870 [Thermoprotei archaeon]
MHVTLEAVILTSVMATAMVVALYTAYNMVEAQVQAVDFNNAKNLVKYLAEAIEQLAAGSGGARYVRFPVIKGAPEYRADAGVLRVYVYDGGSWVEVLNDTYDVFMYRGGELASTPDEVVRPELRPEVRDELVVGLADPVVVVYTTRVGGRPYVVLEAARVRAGYLGVYSVGRAFEEEKYHVYMLEYIRLVVGNITGTDSVVVVAENAGASVRQYLLQGAELSIRVERDGEAVTVTLTPDDIGAASSSCLLLRVVEVRVRGP